ncbi:MAG: alpha/beta fold hydrolase [Myxococcales bacterium]|nr:alpha/beta fold hydrolase [Myxococcales bacterium]
MTYTLAFDRYPLAAASPSAPWTVLVHAFPFDRRMWKHVAQPLAKRRNVLAPDLRGFGHSSSMPSPRTLDEHADDLAQTMDSLAIERASIVGLSLGGYVALAFAERHRARVSQLALVDSRTGPDSDAAKQGRRQSMAIVSSQGVTALYQGLEQKLFSPEPLPIAADMMRAIAVSQGRDGVLAALAAMRDRPDRTSVWEELDVPSLCVVGRHDAITPVDEMQQLADRAHSGRCVVIENSGHLPSAEAPERLVEALDAFLRVE